jgi:hypothetical protein
MALDLYLFVSELSADGFIIVAHATGKIASKQKQR